MKFVVVLALFLAFALLLGAYKATQKSETSPVPSPKGDSLTVECIPQPAVESPEY